MPRGVPGRPHYSCRHCLAWGLGFHHGVCRPCREFARRWPVGACGACHRRLPVKKEHCRLCWCQARLDRCEAMGGAAGTYTLLLPYVGQVRYQQLFLDGLPAPIDLHPKPELRHCGTGSAHKGIRRRSPPPVAGRPDPDWLQPPLFHPPPRAHRCGVVDLRSQPVPDNPWLRWALHLADGFAEARGFADPVRETLNRWLIVLLAGHTDDEKIRFSQFQPLMRGKRRRNCPDHVAHVLDLMGVLTDDRQPAIDGWLERKLAGIAPGIARPTHRWARELLDGGPRTKPRGPNTVRNLIAALRPALLEWSSRHEHLREITREHILAHVTALRGQQRKSVMTGLRSLFGWAKRNGFVFRDPTSRISSGRDARPIPQPLKPEQIAPSIQAAQALHARVAIALAAVHAARHGDIRNLKLSDLDLGNRRLTIAGHTRPMDELTHWVLVDWLEHRRSRWPNTANPHLLVSMDSALRLGPVSHPWLNRILRGLPAILERLRVDRQLEEALASGADPLHLAAVFGIAETTALRYAEAARQLLQPDPGPGTATEEGPGTRVEPQ